jgi:hypothetical protein
MNTRTYAIGRTAESEDFAKSHDDQAPFIMDLGTVSKETKTASLPSIPDNTFQPGTMGA